MDFLKKIFSRHGVPEDILSDNGTQFHPTRTSPFQKFAEEWGFIHRTSSPLYPQSNGFAENAVKIVKNLLTKNSDPYKALLEYRATPLANGYSPGELLMGRRLRSTLPMDPTRLIPTTVDIPALKGKENSRRDRQQLDFNRRHGVISKPDLTPGEAVWVRDRRIWGKIVGNAGTPRSYIVDTSEGRFRRNSSALRRSFTTQLPHSSQDPVIPDVQDTEDVPSEPEMSSASSPAPVPSPSPPRRSGRSIRPPRRLIEEY